MASTAVVLDIRANTQKALGEFKKFSAQLDNKFLISGLKLDVVRNALSQINKEFQRAIGEQGLGASSSLRAAENQAALLTSTFKDFSLTAAKAITDDISNALNQVAVTAGGTMDDVKAALQATPFISNTLSQDLKKELTSGILEFQRDIRRAGLGDEFGTIAKDILSGQADVLQLVNSGTPIGSAIGRKLQKAGVNDLRSLPPAQRTQLLQSILNDKELQALLKETAKETAGYKIILEDLNTALFNPKSGIFGYLRKVTLQSRNLTTNVFDETYKLVDSVFGKEGLFVNFFRSVAKVFGIEDPLKFIIRNIVILTDQFNKLNNFIQSEAFQNIITKISEVFGRIKKFFTRLFDSILEATGSTSFENLIDRIGIAISKVFEFFTNIYNFIEKEFQNPDSILGNIRLIGTSVFGFFGSIVDTIKSQDWDPDKIISSVKKIGANVRKLIENVGKSIREVDVEKQGAFFLDLFKTIIGEVAQTLGTAIKEAILLIFSGKGLAVLVGVIDVLYSSLSKLFTGIFGGNEVGGKIAGAIAGTAVLAIFAKKIKTAVMSFLNRLVDALPGSSFIKSKVKGLFQGDKKTPRKGSMDVFQRAVLRYLRNIERCVCKNALGGGRRRPDRGARDLFTGRRYPQNVPKKYQPEIDLDVDKTTPARRVRRQYTAPIGPAEMGSSYPWKQTRSGYQPYMASDLRVRDPSPEVLGRYNRRMAYRQSFAGRSAGFMRGARRFGKGALIAGGITAGIGLLSGGAAQAGEIDPMTGRPKPTALSAAGNVLGGGVEGAMLGATIGSIVPGIGTAAGAVIGGIIGGVAPLMDKGVRDALGKFLTDIASSLLRVGTDLVDGIKNAVMNGFNIVKNWASGIDWKQILLDAILPGRAIARNVAQSTGASEGDGWMAKAIRFFTGASDTGNAKGANFIGPALAQESRMSGGKAMVVNNKEFVIPPGGFSTLANLVALKNTTPGSMNATQAQAAPVINISVSVSGVLSESDLEDTLREPVSNIVEDAYRRASATTPRGVPKTV